METTKSIVGFEIGGTNIKVIILEDKSYDLRIININDHIVLKYKTNENSDETIKNICNDILAKTKEITKIGISCFGPICISKNKKDYGKILNTPKKGWAQFDIISTISLYLNVSKNIIEIETDVNAAAKLEKLNNSLESLAYITIGTGCGIGVISQNNLVHGLLHPEGGHIMVKKHSKDNFKGVCPFHGDCAEGLITNVSIKERKGLNDVDDVASLSDDDEIWDVLSFYIAQVCLNLLYLASVEKIYIGGGVINREILLPKIRKYFVELNNNYISMKEATFEGVDDFIVRTEYKNDSGILSAIALVLKTEMN